MGLTTEQLIEVPGMMSRWVRLASGAKAHYMTSGEDGPNVVLLHGGFIGSSGAAGWRQMAPFLGSRGFRVYCPDMPAFGITEDPAGEYDYGQAGHIDFLHDFVNALCLETFHLAGNSMGSTNTAYYLVAHPERVTSFAMIAGGIGDLMPISSGTGSAPPSIPAFDGSAESMREALSVILYSLDDLDDDLIAMRTFAANKNRERYERFRESWVASLRGTASPNVSARLRTKGRLDELTIPGIYLYGMNDVLAPVEVGYQQETLLPRVQFFYPERTGHQGQTDRPDLFGDVFLEFFRDGIVSSETAVRAGVSGNRPTNRSLVGLPHSRG